MVMDVTILGGPGTVVAANRRKDGLSGGPFHGHERQSDTLLWIVVCLRTVLHSTAARQPANMYFIFLLPYTIMCRSAELVPKSTFRSKPTATTSTDE